MTLRQRLTLSPNARRHVPWALGIFALAIVLRAAWVAYANHAPGHDGWLYWFASRSIAAGDGFRNPFTRDYSATMAPGYPYVLATIFAVFGSSLIAAKALNIVIGAATAVLVYTVATRLRGQRTGIVAGLVMALFPSQVFFTSVLMTETLFVFLSAALVLVLTLLLVGARAVKPWQLLALGLLLGFMALVRAEAIMLVPLLLVLWKLLGHRWMQVAQVAALVAVGMAVFIVPWTVRNYVRLDEVVLIRKPAHGEGSVLRVGLSPDYETASDIGGEPLTWDEIAERYTTRPWNVATLAKDKLSDFYGRDDPFRWIVEVSSYSRGNVPALSEDEESRWSALANGYYYVVGAVALLGVPFWFSRRDKALLIVLWFAASWSLIHLALAPTVRLHFPLIPMIAIMAGFSLVATWERYGAPRIAERHLARAEGAAHTPESAG